MIGTSVMILLFIYIGSGEVKITLLYDRTITFYEDILEIVKPKLEILRECTEGPWIYTLSATVEVGE